MLDSAKSMAHTITNTEGLSRELNKSTLARYSISPGDVLVVESPSFESPIRFPADQTVLADGTIDLGRYGRLAVAGMTVEEIEVCVQQRVEQIEGDIDPINVRMIDAAGAVYYVLGEVNAPGSYPLVGRETVLDAIVNAGGLTDRASSCEIVLSRPTMPDSCRVVLPVCYRQITQLGDTTTNYQLRPGDRIFVGTRGFMEELMFWKSREACPSCGKKQCACDDPSIADGQLETITSLTEPPVLPKMPPPLPKK